MKGGLQEGEQKKENGLTVGPAKQTCSKVRAPNGKRFHTEISRRIIGRKISMVASPSAGWTACWLTGHTPICLRNARVLCAARLRALLCFGAGKREILAR